MSIERRMRNGLNGLVGPSVALLLGGLGALVSCSSGGSGASSESVAADAGRGDITYRSDITPVTRAEDARKSTFIPPFTDCRDPKPGDTGQGPNGQVCTHVMISGCTEEGKAFADYASCDVVLTQRPYWYEAPAKTPPTTGDPRLKNSAYLADFAWVKTQVEASGCACCHESRVAPGGKAAQWDIDLGPLWIDSLSDSGLALFTGLADSSVLGVYPPDQNHGFERDLTGVPSTDGPRMQKIMLAELARRGLTEADAKAVPPFGGPIYTNSVKVPTACGAGEGVDPDGLVHWKGAAARYVYVLADDTKNPGVPPNLDLPDGTVWRLDVLASHAAVPSGVAYGETPEGTFQDFPEHDPAAPLEEGTRYHLFVYQDVGLPLANCIFIFGKAVPPVKKPADAGASATTDAGGTVATSDASTDGAGGGSQVDAGGGASCGAAKGFGTACSTSADCPCTANYCALQPGQAGYCSVTGCKDDASLCPSGWSCFDVSLVAAGQPSVCTKP